MEKNGAKETSKGFEHVRTPVLRAQRLTSGLFIKDVNLKFDCDLRVLGNP